MAISFRGGVHPGDQKRHTAAKPIEAAPVPQQVVIPVRQHIGAPGTPIVQVGDSVKKGQVIIEANAFVSSPIHASISGTVAEIAVRPHPVFGGCPAVVITGDGRDEWLEGLPVSRDWRTLATDAIKEIIRSHGIVGLGGAAFPTHVKVSPPPDKAIDTLILNGAECEPYLTADHRVMLEYTQTVLTGMQILMKILNLTQGYIGLEANKADAVAALQQVCQGSGIEVKVLPVKYPQGAEKNLIKAIVNREVPSGKLPLDVGVVVQNIGTVVAVAEAVTQGRPLIQRVVTVTGGAIREPKNLLLRIGTPFAAAVALCGGYSRTPVKLIMGGPMMGMAQADANVPVIKGTSGILALSAEDLRHEGAERPCIRCGRCVRACPMGLTPSMLSILSERGKHELAKEDYSLLDCVECGCCVYTCPAKRNIVQYVKLSKAYHAAKAAKK